jgi:hypothetical protein
MAGSAVAATGDSPWANLFDDDAAKSPSTLQSGVTVTPLPMNTKKDDSEKRADVRTESKSRAWLRPLIIVGAAIAGFIIGALCLFLLLK